MADCKNCAPPFARCGDIIASGCVRYTGTLLNNSILDIEGCDFSINELFEKIDSVVNTLNTNFNNLVNNAQVNALGSLALNGACADFFQNTINTYYVTGKYFEKRNPATGVDEVYYYNTDIVLQIIKELCELRSEGFLNIKLPQDFLDDMGDCFKGILTDPCDEKFKISTVGDLLKHMTDVICEMSAKLKTCCP